MARPEDYLVGIDVGSAKIGVLIGLRDESGGVEIVGKGEAPNRGTRKGNIVNVEATVEAIRGATEEAEVMAGMDISHAYVGLAGADVRSVNCRGMVSVKRKDREIGREDIERVLEASQSIALPPDREILHALPQEFLVDEQGGIAEPLGMLGSRLEVLLHLVTGNVTRSKTLLTCVNRAGIEVLELVFEPLATAEAVLTRDERELGVLLVDMGAGTTEYALFVDGEVQHSGVLPVGANHFTSDLATVLRTPHSEAERLKVREGCCMDHMVPGDEGISVPSLGGGTPRVVPRRQLCAILQPRAEEMCHMLQEELARHGFEDAPRAGVVLTGGGAQLSGLLEMAEQVFDSGVRYGLPYGFGGLVDVISTPGWCTASGLLRWGVLSEQNRNRRRRRSPWNVKDVMGSLKGMFEDLL